MSADHLSQLSPPLQPLLTELQSRWVRDFLFSPSAIHLNHLLSPSLSANSVQVFRQALNLLPSSKLPIGKVDMISNGLLVPVFTVDLDTYGVGVIRHKSPTTPGLMRNTERKDGWMMNIRFVISPLRQTFMHVYHLPKDHSFVVTLTCLDSLTKARSYAYILDQRQFLEHSSAKENSFRESDILPSLIFMQEDFQNISCVFCGATWRTPCLCKMSCVRPMHPFDYAHFERNIQPFINEFEPVCRTVHFAYGSCLKWKTDAAYMDMKSVVEQALSKDMVAWSISDYLKGTANVPSLLTVETQDEENPVNRTPTDQLNASYSEPVGWSSNEQSLGFPLPDFNNDDLVDELLEGQDQENIFETDQVHVDDHVNILDTASARPPHQSISPSPPQQQVLTHSSGNLSLHASIHQGTVNQRDTNAEEVSQLGSEKNANFADGNRQEEVLDKIELRRLRNRQSARRSYERKKAEISAMERQLEDEKARVEDLRALETELRRDNVRMRGELNKRGGRLV